ncbi:MAG: glycosyltransferase family 8 protein [Oscillospiraceae bacterium]|nr:glycosyltransferase family 8 protein [Oscillospiraceae bacterium]
MIKKWKSRIKTIFQKGFFFILIRYTKNVVGGYKIYKSIMEKYGSTVAILAHGWPGMGDIFLLHEYLGYFLEKNKIETYVIIVPGSAAYRTVKLFGIKNIEQISVEENKMLAMFKMFMTHGAKNLYIIHHDPPAIHTGIGGRIQGLHRTTTRDMLLEVCFGLNKTEILPSSEAHFENDKKYLANVFKKNHLKPGKTVILSPYANSCASALPMQTWVRIAKTLKKLGLTVCTNSIGKNEPAVEGTRAISIPLKYSKPFLEYAGYFIGMRSGLCDVVGRADCKMYVVYRGGNICGCNQESDYFNLIKIGLSSSVKEYAPYDNTVRIVVDEILTDIAQYLERKKQNSLGEICNDQGLQPAFKNNNIAIVFSCSNEYVPYLFVTIQSILDHACKKNNYDIIILEEDITKENYILLKESYSRFNVSIRFINISKTLSDYEFYTWGWYRPIMYGRFLIMDLMKQYEKVLYLDCDLIVLHDIADLYNLTLNDTECMAAARDVGMINTYCTPRCKEKEYFDHEIKLKNPLNYINSGVILFSIPALRREYTIEQILKHAASKKWRWQDQDVLMTLFEGKIKFLDQSWNVMIQSMEGYPDLMGTYAPTDVQEAYIKARENPKIVHYIDNKYLRFDPVCDLYHYFWKYAKKTPYYELILLRAFIRNH